MFGGTEAVPPVLLNPSYGTVIRGQPLEAAVTLNRLQRLAKVPLLNAADFEFGVGMRIAGGTEFPRAMAFGATGDPSLAERAARIIAEESRAIGVHVDFAPVADVNNNPRNPVINTRSFGEDPAKVGAMAAAFVRGLKAGGVLATLKHFPGHGDTDIDTHLGLPVLPHDRARLDQVELPPFRLGLAAGADAVMVAHVELPALDPAKVPSTFSQPTIDGLLRRDLGFNGLVYTDSMSMAAIAAMASPGEAAARAVEAGADLVAHSPDDVAAAAGIRAAFDRGEITMARIDASVRRVLTAKARLRLDESRLVDVERVAASVGGRAHQAVAREVSERSVTLVKDAQSQVPLNLAREKSRARDLRPRLSRRLAHHLARTHVPACAQGALAQRDGARAVGSQHGGGARAGHGHGAAVRCRHRRHLRPRRVGQRPHRSLAGPRAPGQRARARRQPSRPVVACFFGNPYVAASVSDVPAMLLTYDFGDLAESSAVRVLAGEIRATGRLPITIPGL